jgi:hypothetical protein
VALDQIGYPEHMTTRQQAEEQIARALDEIRSAYADAAAAITGIADPQQAFEAADTFAEEIRRLYEQDAAELRNLQVDRIWEAEQMTAVELARRVGVSKQRAHQILNRARTGESSP